MILAHKIKLCPTREQETYFRKACGAQRHIYNWGLDFSKRRYVQWKECQGEVCFPDWVYLGWILTRRKKTNPKFSWLNEVRRSVLTHALINLDKAFKNMYRRIKKGEKPGFPKFKKKGVNDSFYVHNQSMIFQGKKLILSRCRGARKLTIKMREELRFDGKIEGATISRDIDKWFISVQVNVGSDYKKQRVADNKIGLDMGISHAIVTSDGQIFNSPKPLQKNNYKQKRKQRQLSKKKKGSKNRNKARLIVARQHQKIRNIRKDFLHKATTKLCSENQAITIEDLNVKGMIKNHKLALALSDVGLGEIRRQLEYKVELYDVHLAKADRWFPSSKLCSKCGWKNEALKLSDRTFKCESCGLEIDRDLNAAINLLNYPGTQGK